MRPTQLILLGLLTCAALAQPLAEGRVRVEPLQGRDLPTAYQKRPRRAPPQAPITAADWRVEVAGYRADIRVEGEYIRLRTEKGKKLWVPQSEVDLLRPLLTGLPPKRDGANGYWFNQLLDEYQATGQLIALRDDSAVEMTFFLDYPADLVTDALPQALAEMGLGVDEILEFDGFYQMNTTTKQEKTPGIFNPDSRRYSLLINVYDEGAESRVTMRATVMSWYESGDYGYAWRADESPSIRQRLREVTAQTLTSLVWPAAWREVVEDYRDGYQLPAEPGRGDRPEAANEKP
jgi:hypothetical protein